MRPQDMSKSTFIILFPQPSTILHSLTQGIADHLIPLPRQTPRSDPRGHSCPCCQHPISPVSITNHLSHIYLSINKHVNTCVFPIPTTTAFMQPPLFSALGTFCFSPVPFSSSMEASVMVLEASVISPFPCSKSLPCLVYAV